MVQASIKMIGFVQALSAVRAIGEAGRAVNGPLASFGSRLPYARPIEKNEFLSGPRKGQIARRAGPANMFRDGVAATVPQVAPILGPAIVKGPAAVGQAKRKIRDIGLTEIKKRTPVRSTNLRESVQVLERPS